VREHFETLVLPFVHFPGDRPAPHVELIPAPAVPGADLAWARLADLRRMASLQAGGITTRAGLVQVHPREAVIPLERFEDGSRRGDVHVNTTLNIQQGDGGRSTDSRGRGGRPSRDNGAADLQASLNAVLEAWVRNEQRPGGVLEGTRRV
jgi:hypothetical protein